jgi:ABC-2 type transport system ATP-binding protein
VSGGRALLVVGLGLGDEGKGSVVDALVQGEHVRLVTAEARLPGPVAGMAGIVAREIAPRFEDAFIDLLRRQQGGAPGAARMSAAAAPPAPAADDVIIRVRGLRRRFGDFWAVDGVDLHVRHGEIFGLLGANGAGKTTTFRMLCGLLPASAGHLEVAGHDLRHAASAARARIGYMSQKFSLYGNLSVAQNLDFFASAYGLAGAARRSRIDWAQGEFELAAFAGQLAADLPLGYKQRLAMACALMHRPEILFLDEPTSGVDPLARREFWKRINALARAGVTVMVTTHFMEEAEYCDRLAIMAAGRILATGEPSAIKAMARNAENPEPSLEDAFIRLVEDTALAEAA